jgi:hypothetical protein
VTVFFCKSRTDRPAILRCLRHLSASSCPPCDPARVRVNKSTLWCCLADTVSFLKPGLLALGQVAIQRASESNRFSGS